MIHALVEVVKNLKNVVSKNPNDDLLNSINPNRCLVYCMVSCYSGAIENPKRD